MSIYTFFQYLNYRRKAMGRHGTHSPFIYDLVENCIQRRGKNPLLLHLANYLNDWKIIRLKDDEHWKEKISSSDMSDGKWLIVVPAIYTTKDATRHWLELSSDSQVSYSIDFFEFGLLLINPEFLQKQHFILKR